MRAVRLLAAVLLLSGCDRVSTPVSHAATATPASAAKPAPAAALPSDSVYQLSLPLTDQDGHTRDWRAHRGRPQLASMFYTSCRYVCPLIVDAGKSIDAQLTPVQRARMGVLLISMDPRNDTPTALHGIVDKRHLDTKRWSLASPRQQDVRAVAGVLGIRYRQLDDGSFNHSTALVLLDRDGRIVARSDKVGRDVDPAFVAQVRKLATP
ncbi:SCO family protein [Cognatilysobacter lacus]|uniref:SCO family protein n=1 Tax=Cognatilysobacter lacus TaxID=1643323 RepID=A0A5D8Z7X8_9GAMM|nr:SCO family protein [Lysobacter lacus]TZF90646.1 SCO family protein [Lysobacter lacus]